MRISPFIMPLYILHNPFIYRKEKEIKKSETKLLTHLRTWYIITMLFKEKLQGLYAISPSFYGKSETPGGVEH